MAIHFESQVKTLNEAKSDFLKTAKKATKALGRERDRLVANLKKTNARIKRNAEPAQEKNGSIGDYHQIHGGENSQGTSNEGGRT